MAANSRKAEHNSVPKRVSVIIVNYNCMKDVDVCLESVLKQTYSDFEVLFVDNASTDGSLEHARSRFPGLIFVANQANLGYAGGINSALPHATGEFVAPLNIDTEVAPNWLAVMVEFLEGNPQVGAVTPKILLFDDRSHINAMGHNVHISGMSFCRRLYEADDGGTDPQKVSGLSGCSFLIRRTTLEELGGEPADSFMSNDDVIVSWLLQLMRYEIYCVPKAVVFHKYRLKVDPAKLLRLERDRGKLLLSTLKPLTLVLCSPLFLGVELMTLAYSVLRGRAYARAKVSALALLWPERGRIAERRRQYRKIRKVSDWDFVRRLRWNLEWKQLFHTMG